MDEKRIRFGLREKVLLTVLGASMLITTVIGVIFYSRSVESVKNNYEKSVRTGLQVCMDTFDAAMKEAYFACAYAAGGTELPETMQQHDDGYANVITLLQQYRSSSAEIYSVYCYVKDANELIKVGTDSTIIVKGTAEILDWMNSATQFDTDNPFSPRYNIDTSSVIQRRFFTYGKRVYDEEKHELGRIFVNVDERNIYFKCLKQEETRSNSAYITFHGLVVCSADTSQFEERLLESKDSIQVSLDAVMTDYSMVSSADLSEITGDLRSTRNWIFFVTLLLNLLLAVPVIFIVRSMMKPMQQLERTMEKVMDGDMSVRAEIYHHDEIGSLSLHFNEMIQQIEQLIDELVTEKMLKKEAEIEALQYQITPHFMYNTLSSIRYAAKLDHSERIAELLQAFIELLRMSASDRGAFITVQQEMQMVNNYAMLQKFRYADSFDVTIDIAAGTERFYVPRLLIQPLVENAILHGLDHKQEHNQITVSVIQDMKYLVLKVEDNGAGMTGEEIQALMTGARRSKFNGIGISNIKERLKLYYGEQGTLQYRSVLGQGTAAIITLPASDDPTAYTI